MTHYFVIQTGTDMVGMISNVGFPIAAFLLMYRLATKTMRENTEAIQSLTLQLEGMGKDP
jgi:hypothetical protein